MAAADSGTQEWRSTALPRYARMTRQVEALIAGAYLAGTNTHRVKRALAALFGRAVGKDVVGGTWRKVRTDWDGRNKRDMADEDVIRLILDGDRRARAPGPQGHEHFAAGGARRAARRAKGNGLGTRGLRTPEFLVTDTAAGMERALAALWPEVPARRCTVHKHRNLLGHAPDALHEEVTADYTDMTYAETVKGVQARHW